MPRPAAQFTHGVTIAAPPERIWPWLLQMGCRRAGYYSVDTLDNGGKRSARELHPDLADLHVGQILPATPGGEDGFEVLRIEAPHTLVLGGLWDVRAHRQLPFASPRPARFSQVTWAFALEPLAPGTTRLHVRARGDFSADGRWHAFWIRPVHHLMQTTQLRNLAARAEGRMPTDDWRDVLAGLGGAALIAFNFLTPFRRHQRSHWGLDQAAAARAHPGDQLIPTPRWSWTHAVEIDAPASAVWGWVAQIGADRGGFYSYQWLENVAGCGLHNAERVHPEWELHPGHRLLLHPKMPPLSVVDVCPGRYFVAYGEPDPVAVDTGEPWLAATWLFHLEPLGEHRCRLVSRFRSDYSNQLATRLANSPALVEPVGFAMDRRMLLGIKERAEAAWAQRRHDATPAGAAPPAG